MAFTSEELDRIAESSDFRIAPYREDGETPGTLTYIWSVVFDGEVYVRPYHGIDSSWYQAAITQKAGRVTVAGMDRKVRFHHVSGLVVDEIDQAYRHKYGHSQYLDSMISDRARAATIRVTAAD